MICGPGTLLCGKFFSGDSSCKLEQLVKFVLRSAPVSGLAQLGCANRKVPSLDIA